MWIYQIYRSYSETGEYALVRDFPASADLATYVDGGLEPNTVYYYKAIACNGAYCSEDSDEWGGLTEVVGPVDIPAVPTVQGEKVNIPFGTDLARVHWDALPGATFYRVYHDNDLDAEVSAPAAGCTDHSDTVILAAPP